MVTSRNTHFPFNAIIPSNNTSYLGTAQSRIAFPNIIPNLAGNYFYSPHIILFLYSGLALPQAPTGLKATPSNGWISLSWTASDNGALPITGYKIERSLDG